MKENQTLLFYRTVLLVYDIQEINKRCVMYRVDEGLMKRNKPPSLGAISSHRSGLFHSAAAQVVFSDPVRITSYKLNGKQWSSIDAINFTGGVVLRVCCVENLVSLHNRFQVCFCIVARENLCYKLGNQNCNCKLLKIKLFYKKSKTFSEKKTSSIGS